LLIGVGPDADGRRVGPERGIGAAVQCAPVGIDRVGQPGATERGVQDRRGGGAVRHRRVRQRGVDAADIPAKIPHRYDVVGVVLQILHHVRKDRRLDAHRRMLHVRHAVEGENNCFACDGLAQGGDEGGGIRHAEGGHIKRTMNGRIVGRAVAASPDKRIPLRI